MTWTEVAAKLIEAIVVLGGGYLGYLKIRAQQDEHGKTISDVRNTQIQHVARTAAELSTIKSGVSACVEATKKDDTSEHKAI